MVFSSEAFLFLFLPVFMAAYFLTPFRWRSLTILVGSYVFYGWWRVDFLLLLIATTGFAFWIGQRIAFYRAVPLGRLYLTLGVAGCLAVLAVFKYLNFFVDSFADLVGKTPEELGVHWRLILPIGISFYVFQAISYLVDVYRSDARASHRLLDFAAFIALFPQLIAGPILRYKDLEDQFQKRTHSVTQFSEGLARFLIGLGKKVLLADSLAPLVAAGFDAGTPSATLAWLAAIAFALQLYFDFSGYSDMAIGLGRMMGFTFPENFRHPYVSRSITEFWRRWHISLSTWLRDYLYIPLGGSRRGALRTYANLGIVMLLGGLWHGANWTFVLWGLWHGGLLACERAVGWDQRARNVAFARALALLCVLLGWVMFRASSVPEAWQIYQGMVGLNGLELTLTEARLVSRESLLVIVIAALVVCLEPSISVRPQRRHPTRRYAAPQGQTLAIWVTPGVLFVGAVTVLKLAEQSFSPFLYFQF
ncbi:MBOAT family protein [Cognatishimia sp.]|uniref:MBOAT family O-acyltransferase n=1 Tax=Cognatishimia sp. TaxID=2211648 RepID=UPI003514DAEA